jgi:hypothetical protein
MGDAVPHLNAAAGAHHVARFLVVTITVAIAARRLAEREK